MYTSIINKKIRNYVAQGNTKYSITGVSSLSSEPIKPRQKETTTNDSFLEVYYHLRDFQIPIKKNQIPRFKYQFDLELWAKEQVKDFLFTGKFKLHSIPYDAKMLESDKAQLNINITPKEEIA